MRRNERYRLVQHAPHRATLARTAKRRARGMPHASSNPSISSALRTTPTRPPPASTAEITACWGSDNSPAGVLTSTLWAMPRCSTNRSGTPATMPRPTQAPSPAPPHYAMIRHLAGRRDLEPQRIDDLPGCSGCSGTTRVCRFTACRSDRLPRPCRANVGPDAIVTSCRLHRRYQV